MKSEVYNFYKRHRDWQQFYKELLEENEVTQITVTNCSNEQREITLWGANKCAPLTDPLYGNEIVTQDVDIVHRSDKVVYNPVNNLFYVISNRSASIRVVNDQAEVVQVVSLLSGVVTTLSPISIVVNTNPNSLEYGHVAVIGNNQFEFITVDLNFQVARRIPLSSSPIDLVYHPLKDAYMICLHVSDSVVKIEALDTSPSSFINNVPGIKTIGVNTDSGDLYLHNTLNNDVDIYNVQGLKIGAIQRPTTVENTVSFYYHPVNQKMYISYDQLNSMVIIDGVTLGFEKQLDVGLNPIDIQYHPIENYIYVANQGEQLFTRIDNDLQIVDKIELAAFQKSFAINSSTGYFALNNSVTSKLTIVYRDEKLLVKVSDNYESIREDFKYNPMIITHMKVVATTDARINTLQIIETSISGKQTCEPISLRSYHSPQGFGNVSEVFEMEGYIIDGRVCWRFTINPNQQVTFLLYYKQLEMYNFLPEKSRVSTGVQQSKGIPLSWIQED